MYHPEFCEPTAFIFALLWLSPESTWKIHGLWPQTCKQCENCGYPSYCRSNVVHFNESAIKTLHDRMYKLWYPDKGLIQHEWLKHGSCDGNITEFAYFNTTLSLVDCINYTSECTNHTNKHSCRIWLEPWQIRNCM